MTTSVTDLLASRAAQRQYRMAARLHAKAADDLKRKGYPDWAEASERISERLSAAADAEATT